MLVCCCCCCCPVEEDSAAEHVDVKGSNCVEELSLDTEEEEDEEEDAPFIILDKTILQLTT